VCVRLARVPAFVIAASFFLEKELRHVKFNLNFIFFKIALKKYEFSNFITRFFFGFVLFLYL